MTGVIINYPGLFTDTSLPIYKLDPLLTDAAGSLLLVDTRNWATGVPAHGATLPNLAREQAAALGLSATDAVMQEVGDLSGALGLVERTSAGGLHTIVRQSSAVPANNGFNIQIADSLLAYLVGHPTHEYYVSQWRTLTRIALATAGAKTFLAVERNPNGTVGYLRMATSDTYLQPTSTYQTGRYLSQSANALGAVFDAVSGKTSDTAPTTAAYSNAHAIAQGGAVANQNTYAPLLAALPSWVFYRTYIEDLTVSGRTFAQVQAADYALFQAAFGSGGRLAGDTYTAPSTIP